MNRQPRPRLLLKRLVWLALLPGAAHGAPLVNPFHDPFEPVTQGLAACVAPSPPSYTPSQMREEEHWRVEQGNSCYLAGRCRLSNSYLYDAGIAGRLRQALAASAALRDTSVWILVQGRIVELSGCVAQASQVELARRIAEQVPEVQGVVLHLRVGTRGARPYRSPAK